MNIFILLSMIFCHIVDDYYLQGILASMKQKSWWEQNYPDKKYRFDYLAALFAHAFSWTFMVMLPIAVVKNFNVDANFLLMFVSNVALHAQVDHEKANEKSINLVLDQISHIIQIVFTWSALV